ncbi:DUF2441 domain-containing protein [Paenibacillus sp. FSL F4-0236]|uniref:DUF2441 domain-containing protein n=1 Tax=Paenibacillus sp. FSL F4-0236 TaxID=2954731 RepID=UPI0030F550E5
MIAYHIDRSNLLKEGMLINPVHPRINPELLAEVMNRRFPEGLSFHGNHYFARQANSFMNSDGNLISNNIPSVNAYLIDNIFEYERVINFPHRPSRFQSIFCSETVREARIWVEFFQLGPEAKIWEVEIEHENYAKLDAKWLKGDINSLSFIKFSHFAQRYWSGEPNPDESQFELLLKLPVLVKRQV